MSDKGLHKLIKLTQVLINNCEANAKEFQNLFRKTDSWFNKWQLLIEKEIKENEAEEDKEKSRAI